MTTQHDANLAFIASKGFDTSSLSSLKKHSNGYISQMTITSCTASRQVASLIKWSVRCGNRC